MLCLLIKFKGKIKNKKQQPPGAAQVINQKHGSLEFIKCNSRNNFAHSGDLCPIKGKPSHAKVARGKSSCPKHHLPGDATLCCCFALLRHKIH